MIQQYFTGTEKRECVCCRHRTTGIWEFRQTRGVSIQLPVCSACFLSRKKIGLGLWGAMKAHLVSIQASATASRLITEDETRLREIQIKAKEGV